MCANARNRDYPFRIGAGGHAGWHMRLCMDFPAQKTAPSGTVFVSHNTSVLIAARIIRTTICTVRYAIVIAVAIAVAVAFMFIMAIAGLPSASVQMPAIMALLPFCALIMMAAMHALPMAADPHVPSAIPIPITWRPFITAAWRAHGFMSWWRRRCADNNVEAFMCHCFGRHKGSGAHGGDGCSGAE